MRRMPLWSANGACVLATPPLRFQFFRFVSGHWRAKVRFDFAQRFRFTIISFFFGHCLHQECKSLLETIVAGFAALEVPHADYNQIVRGNNEGGLATRA